MHEYDYIIAGGGSAGCALAARLAESKDISVCLIEAGGKGNDLFIKMPAGNGFVFGNPKLDWGYTSIPQKNLNGRKILAHTPFLDYNYQEALKYIRDFVQ